MPEYTQVQIDAAAAAQRETDVWRERQRKVYAMRHPGKAWDDTLFQMVASPSDYCARCGHFIASWDYCRVCLEREAEAIQRDFDAGITVRRLAREYVLSQQSARRDEAALEATSRFEAEKRAARELAKHGERRKTPREDT